MATSLKPPRIPETLATTVLLAGSITYTRDVPSPGPLAVMNRLRSLYRPRLLKLSSDSIRRHFEWLNSERGRRWLLRGILAIAVYGLYTWTKRHGDVDGYILVGRLVLDGGHIYLDAPTINTWPPFFSLVSVPFAVLAAPTPLLAHGFLMLLSYAMLLVVLHLLARLVYDCNLSLRAESAGLSLAAPALLVPLLLTSRYIASNFEHLQVNFLLFAVTLAGLYLQANGRELVGGLAIGLGAALKVMPALFIPYLAYKGRWRAAGYAALATLIFSLSPVLVFGWARFWDYILAWRAALAAGWGSGHLNQSVLAMWDRFIGHGMLPFTVGSDHLAASGEYLVTVVYALSVGLVTLLALWILRGRVPQNSWAALAEWSVVFIISALFGPVARKHYLIVLLLPNTLLFAAWQRSDLDPRMRRTAGIFLLSAFVVGVLTTDGVVGGALAGVLEMTSVVTVAGLIMLGGSLWFRSWLAVHPVRAADQ